MPIGKRERTFMAHKFYKFIPAATGYSVIYWDGDFNVYEDHIVAWGVQGTKVHPVSINWGVWENWYADDHEGISHNTLTCGRYGIRYPDGSILVQDVTQLSSEGTGYWHIRDGEGNAIGARVTQRQRQVFGWEEDNRKRDEKEAARLRQEVVDE
jgi:hypothetical protein